MRPVNLIPLDERRGEQSEARTGPLSYVVIGTLAVLLVAAAALVLTNNQISERKAEVTELEAEVAAASARAEALAAYTQFHAVRTSRTATVASLAESRFDWERVIDELSRVLPSDVWLINLTGTATPAVQVENGASVTGREAVAGPALQLVGCAPGQESVARFVSVLRDIDGVTRVGLSKSGLPESKPSATSADSNSTECQTRDFIAKFELTVAFDAVPVPATATPDPAAPVAPATTTTTTTTAGG